jgi:hypothetical protein
MRTLLAVLVSGLALGCNQEGTEALEGGGDAVRSVADARFDDPEVTRVHSRMVETMAPGNGWERTRYIQWDWMVNRGEGVEPTRRSHRWDRWQNDLRTEAAVDGQQMIALFNHDEPLAGRVWLDGELQEGARADSLLTRANAMFVNDSYWLLMPYKWTDPGVRAEYLGEQTDDDGRRWEVVQLSFEDVGLTPQNMYHAFVNPETGLMERWHYIAREGAEPSMVNWSGWRFFGPIMLAPDRPVDGVSRIYFENLVADTVVPEGALAAPAP